MERAAGSGASVEDNELQRNESNNNTLPGKEPPEGGRTLLEVENLKKYYPIKGGIITHTTGHIHAVDGVSFSVREGETLGLVGESGCGKSTIGRQIVGLEKPTQGVIRYDGRDLSALRSGEMKRIRTQLQMVFQDPYSSLNPRKHIYEILSQPMLYHHIATKETVGKELERLLDMVGLSRNVLGRYPHEFSGGQRQRIGIARALSLNPRLLVCDEPVSALDVSIQAQILNLLKSLQKELNLTCIFVGHGLGAVNYVSDRIAVMSDGILQQVGTPKEIYEHPATRFVASFIGETNLFDGAISESHGDLLTIALECGMVQARASGFGDREMVALSIRPERVMYSTEPVEGFTIKAVVREQIYAGSVLKAIAVLPNGNEVRIERLAGDKLPEDGSVYLYWNPEDARLVHTEDNSIFSAFESIQLA